MIIGYHKLIVSNNEQVEFFLSNGYLFKIGHFETPYRDEKVSNINLIRLFIFLKYGLIGSRVYNVRGN